MLLVVYPILPRLLPHVGTVAPHLHVLLPHADFLTRIIPKLSSRIEDLIPLVEKVGPVFGRLTPLHIEKLELIIDDVVENLDILAPHIDSLMPILADGILVAPKVSPSLPKLSVWANEKTDDAPYCAGRSISGCFRKRFELAPTVCRNRGSRGASTFAGQVRKRLSVSSELPNAIPTE